MCHRDRLAQPREQRMRWFPCSRGAVKPLAGWMGFGQRLLRDAGDEARDTWALGL